LPIRRFADRATLPVDANKTVDRISKRYDFALVVEAVLAESVDEVEHDSADDGVTGVAPVCGGIQRSSKVLLN
jgi:hypothetical protein